MLLIESEGNTMSEYKLKTPRQAQAVVGAYKKIEETVVGAYKKVEDTVVGGYRQIEGKFVDAFLEKAEDEERNGDAPCKGKE